jgi:hypothetical protein
MVHFWTWLIYVSLYYSGSKPEMWDMELTRAMPSPPADLVARFAFLVLSWRRPTSPGSFCVHGLALRVNYYRWRVGAAGSASHSGGRPAGAHRDFLPVCAAGWLRYCGVSRCSMLPFHAGLFLCLGGSTWC